MRRSVRWPALAVGLMLLLAPACGDSSGHSGSHHSAGMSMSGSMSHPFDLAFIDAMIPHHQGAIAMSKDARDAGLSDPDLIAIAANILTSQQREIDQMRAWRNKWYPGEPTVGHPGKALGMTGHDMAMETHMDMGGGNINTRFAAAMLAHHEGAIRMARMALTRAEHPEIRRLAKRIIAAQEAEIDVLRTHTGGM